MAKRIAHNFKDISGKRFGRIVAIKRVRNNSRGLAMFLFLCDCGNKFITSGAAARNGNTKSCGCYKADKLSIMHKKHGASGSRLYKIFTSIKTRCNNKNVCYYKYYGGKGIKCLWKNFDEFKKDMGSKYDKHVKKYGIKNTTIDRIDNNNNYCKKNCRWATFKEQTRNKKNNIFITKNNLTLCVNDWAKKLGLNRTTILSRIRRGWSLEDSINQKLCRIKKKHFNREF